MGSEDHDSGAGDAGGTNDSPPPRGGVKMGRAPPGRRESWRALKGEGEGRVGHSKRDTVSSYMQETSRSPPEVSKRARVGVVGGAC